MWFLLNFAIYQSGEPDAWYDAYCVFIANMHTKNYENGDKSYSANGHDGRFIKDICENLGILVLTYDEF